MRASEGRLLTTHAGSLPRPAALAELMIRRSEGEAVDADAMRAAVEDATAEVLARQADGGVDIATTGEMARESFFTYVRWRMSGFDGEVRTKRAPAADVIGHPDFLDANRARFREGVSMFRAPAATGPVAYAGHDELGAEIDQLRRLAAPHGFTELFLPSPSPGMMVVAMHDRHYGDPDAYLDAVADAIGTEYRAVLDAGLVLQIDAPDLAMERHISYADRPVDDFVAFVAAVVGRIDRVLTGTDRSQVRLHVCWGNYEGPHDHDVELAAVLPVLLESNVGGLVLSQANPRHAHEHRLLSQLPPDVMAVVGVVDSTTNYVEHPRVIADRLVRAAEALGDPTRLVAGTDCGFGTGAGQSSVAPSVVWAKLAALREGADLASAELF